MERNPLTIALSTKGYEITMVDELTDILEMAENFAIVQLIEHYPNGNIKQNSTTIIYPKQVRHIAIFSKFIVYYEFYVIVVNKGFLSVIYNHTRNKLMHACVLLSHKN